jgi:lipopolysaccharide export system protein LptA
MMSLRILNLKRLIFVSLGLITGSWTLQGLAQEPVAAPIMITSEHMTIQNPGQRLVFEGSVHVQKDDFQMDADRMVVNLVPNVQGNASPGSFPVTSSKTQGAAPQSRSVSTINADGHVKIVKGDRRAASQVAIYDQAMDKVTLTGNPESWEKDYKVTGTKITIFLKENRSLVEGSSVLIQP